jgi:NADPH-dependent 2,4-dienoyl-CoA reductase/sulfur reductase-like enzyme
MTAPFQPRAIQPAAIQPVIVGAGPAGVRAAERLVAAGLRPLMIDEAARGGGQIYRQPPDGGFTRAKSALYGFEAAKADALHRTLDGLRDRVDHRPRTLVWNCEERALDLLCDGRTETVPYTHLILATGATDRVLPFPGWTLPGVFTLGGSQVALKFQGCTVGKRVAFLGTGPLLYLVAYQYLKAGVEVAGVFDTTPLPVQARALPGMLRDPVTLAKGLWYVGWLRAHGVPIHNGARPVRVEGDERVSALVWRDAGRASMSPVTAAASPGPTRRSWPGSAPPWRCWKTPGCRSTPGGRRRWTDACRASPLSAGRCPPPFPFRRIGPTPSPTTP